MEISRKKITDEEIYTAETKLAAEVEGAVSEFSGRFDALGYELATEFMRDNENLENEEREELRALEIADRCEYSFGYASGVKITVKRKKDESEEAVEDVVTEGLSEEEAEFAENERILAEAGKEAARDVAFTSMYFVHIYKAFWRESVSISENIDEIRADLDEFITVLTEKANGADAENEG